MRCWCGATSSRVRIAFTSLVAVVPLVVLAMSCATSSTAAGHGAGDAYCHDGWNLLDTVAALPDGTAFAAGSTCDGDDAQSLVRRWDGSDWSDVAVRDVNAITDLAVAPGGTVWGIASDPQPWTRTGSALVEIDDGGLTVRDRFDTEMTSVAIAPDGTFWAAGYQPNVATDAPPADHASPTILYRRRKGWVTTPWGGETTSNGGNWTEPPTIMFVGDTPYASGVYYEDEYPFQYLLRWAQGEWEDVQIPRAVRASTAVASTGSAIVIVGLASRGPVAAFYKPKGGWSIEPIDIGSETSTIAVAANATHVWVVTANGDAIGPVPTAEVRTRSQWSLVDPGLGEGIRLADVAVLPDGTAIAVGAGCCEADAPRDTAAVHLSPS